MEPWRHSQSAFNVRIDAAEYEISELNLDDYH
jgi:hypothetical protein